MPLSLEKRKVLHCGRDQPMYSYNINDMPIAILQTFKDISIIRLTFEACNSSHYQAIYNSTSQVAEAVRRAFRLSAPELLWPAFTGYVLLKLMLESTVCAQHIVKTSI